MIWYQLIDVLGVPVFLALLTALGGVVSFFSGRVWAGALTSLLVGATIAGAIVLRAPALLLGLSGLGLAGAAAAAALRERRLRLAALAGLWGIVLVELFHIFSLTQQPHSEREWGFAVTLIATTLVLGGITVAALPADPRR